jgi:hypothetical protein
MYDSTGRSVRVCVCHSVRVYVLQYTPLMYLQCHVIWLVDSFRDRHRVDNNEDCKDELKDLFGGGTIDGRHGRWSAVCLYTSLLHSCASVCECVGTKDGGAPLPCAGSLEPVLFGRARERAVRKRVTREPPVEWRVYRVGH